MKGQEDQDRMSHSIDLSIESADDAKRVMETASQLSGDEQAGLSLVRPDASPARSPERSGVVIRHSDVPGYRYAKMTAISNKPVMKISDRNLLDVVRVMSTTEGPVHRDEIYERIRDATGQVRLSPTFRDRIDDALRFAVRYEEVRQDGQFVWPADQRPVPVRGPRSDGDVRAFGRIAGEELIEAVVRFVEHNPGVTPDEAIRGAARMLGFPQLRSAVRDGLTEAMQRSVSSGRLRRIGDRLVPARRRSLRPSS